MFCSLSALAKIDICGWTEWSRTHPVKAAMFIRGGRVGVGGTVDVVWCSAVESFHQANIESLIFGKT